MKQEKIAQKTMAMKCAMANKVRTLLFGVKLSQLEPSQQQSPSVLRWLGLNKPDVSKMTSEQKDQLLVEIFNATQFMNRELRSYKGKRVYKAEIQKQRVERGYVPKKKTSFAEWTRMLAERQL